MSKKQQNADVPVNSTLIKSYDEVKEMIANQIDQSNVLLKMDVRGREVIDCGPFLGEEVHISNMTMPRKKLSLQHIINGMI